MALRTLARRRIGRIYHVSFPLMKHVENSVRGIRRAARRLFKAIDLDILITKADPHCPHHGDPEHVNGRCVGHIVGCHWQKLLRRDKFRDPEHRIALDAMVRNLTLDQVLRLKTVDGYRVRRIAALLRACARRRLVALLEPKNDARFAQEWPWKYIALVSEDLGTTVSVRALPQNAEALAPARRVGFEAWEIKEAA